MKVVAFGVKKGHRLRFTAQGADAEQALKAIGDITLVLGRAHNEQTCCYYHP